MHIAKLMYHPYEEDIISGVTKGYKGTYAIFFYGCNMHCVYCQNSAISKVTKQYMDNIPKEKIFTSDTLSDEMIKAEKDGAYSISFITGVFATKEIAETIKLAKEKGLKIPIVYNSSGFETKEHIRRLEGLVDIYLPDLRYMDDTLGQKFSKVNNYVEIAKECIEEMKRQGATLIVRILVLPGHTKDAIDRIKYLYDTYGDSIYISILSQYTPILENEGITMYPELMRKLTSREYEKVVKKALEIGVNRAFVQDIESAKTRYIPDFS